MVVPTSAALASSGVRLGCASNISAAMPDTIAVAWDVPVPLKPLSPTRASGRIASSVLPGARLDTMLTPGATRSGLGTPSPVGPQLENGATRSSELSTVPRRSAAPTVRTKGSSAGLSIFDPPAPRFPAAATTRIPASHSRSTAKSSGSSRYFCEESVPKEMLTTRMPYSSTVRRHPLEAGDHRGDVRRAVPPGDLHRDHVDPRRDTAPRSLGAVPVAGDDAGHVRAVPVPVVAVALRRQVDAREDAVAELRYARDPRVEHRHGHAGPVGSGRKRAEADGVGPAPRSAPGRRSPPTSPGRRRRRRAVVRPHRRRRRRRRSIGGDRRRRRRRLFLSRSHAAAEAAGSRPSASSTATSGATIVLAPKVSAHLTAAHHVRITAR